MAIYTFIFFLLKGDDPEVAILGCATKTTQFQQKVFRNSQRILLLTSVQPLPKVETKCDGVVHDNIGAPLLDYANNAANDNDNADDYYNDNGISIQYIAVRRPRKN